MKTETELEFGVHTIFFNKNPHMLEKYFSDFPCEVVAAHGPMNVSRVGGDPVPMYSRKAKVLDIGEYEDTSIEDAVKYFADALRCEYESHNDHERPEVIHVYSVALSKSDILSRFGYDFKPI